MVSITPGWFGLLLHSLGTGAAASVCASSSRCRFMWQTMDLSSRLPTQTRLYSHGSSAATRSAGAHPANQCPWGCSPTGTSLLSPRHLLPIGGTGRPQTLVSIQCAVLISSEQDLLVLSHCITPGEPRDLVCVTAVPAEPSAVANGLQLRVSHKAIIYSS